MVRLRDFRLVGLVVGFVALGLALPVYAVIERDYPLSNAIADSDFILVAKIERLDAAKRTSIWNVDQVLHGKPDFKRLPVRLEGMKPAETTQLLERIAPEQPVILFITELDEGALATGFANGTWFQLKGTKTADGLKWQFTHIEPYLRRTFKGTTAELTQVMSEVLSGKREAPKSSPKEKPGLGPTLAEIQGK